MAVCSVELPPEVSFRRRRPGRLPPVSARQRRRADYDADEGRDCPAGRASGPGLGAGVFGDEEYDLELRGETEELEVTDHVFSPSHGLSDDHSLDDFE